MQSDTTRQTKLLPGSKNHQDAAMSVKPRDNLTTTASRPGPPTSRGADPDRNPTRVVSALALASLAAGAINIAAAATIGRSSAENLAFFVAVSAMQLVWGTAALVRAPRWWLAVGAVGNLAVVATWVVSRSVGLPAGVDAHIILPARFPDTLATALETVIVVGAAALMIPRRHLAQSAARSPRVTAAAAVVLGALALGGVLDQAGVFNSSPSGNGGGVNGPAAPGGGGGGSSGGGIYGGGSSGSGTSSGGTSSGATSSGGSSGGGYSY